MLALALFLATPAPGHANPLLQGQARLEISRHFPQQEWLRADCIVWAESRYDPERMNPVSGAAGIWQLMSFHEWRGETDTERAHALWAEQSWRPWSTKGACQ